MKKKVGNRLIALLLALFMAVTMMPDMAVGAEETDNGVADEAQKCGYEQPKAINVGELDEDEAEDLPIVRAQYNAADASYWAVYGSDYYYSKMSGAEKQFYQALYDDFKVYVRPLSMFLSETDFVKYPDSTQPMRFERIDAEDDRNVPKPLETTSCEPSFEETTEELPDGISPKLIAFLDADSDEERYTILNEMEDIVDDHMIDTMAVVMDTVIPEGDLDKRYDDLRYVIRTRQQYEFANRLR